MIVMRVACEHGCKIIQRPLATVGRVDQGSVGGMTSDHITGLEHRSCQRTCRGRLSPHETSPDREHAADAISKFAREIGQDLVTVCAKFFQLRIRPKAKCAPGSNSLFESLADDEAIKGQANGAPDFERAFSSIVRTRA